MEFIKEEHVQLETSPKGTYPQSGYLKMYMVNGWVWGVGGQGMG